MNSGKSVIDKILSGSIEKLARSQNKQPPHRETLKLYREVIKFSKKIDWTDQNGMPWYKKRIFFNSRRESIVKSARDEIVIARDEKDPLLIMRMILTSREAMRKLSDKVCLAYFV
jgi:hypothetical protein